MTLNLSQFTMVSKDMMAPSVTLALTTNKQETKWDSVQFCSYTISLSTGAPSDSKFVAVYNGQ